MSTPNLFDHATSELSQDAFICWLLSWAKKSSYSKDSELHKCALSFIEVVFKKHSKSVPHNISSVNVLKQHKNIDVLCIINDEYAILIEDKTSTSHHSNQLTRYYAQVEGMGFEPDNILSIYYKTEEQSCYKTVIRSKFQPLLRDEILTILNTYSGGNQILVDYREHLGKISQKVLSFKTAPIETWTKHSWIGFYLELQKRLHSGNWRYVANPSGGFMGFWWNRQKDSDCEQYLQLEEKTLCYKIRVDDKDRRKKLRTQWHKKILTENDKKVNNIVKPDRFGNGRYMTVCIHKGDYRAVDDKNIIDMAKTIEILKSAENLLNKSCSINSCTP